MILIHCALQLEAKILIEHYKLKKEVSFKAFDFFRNQDISLVISGLGKLNAAAAISSILTRLNLKQISVLNFGLAGATEDLSIGELFLINKITDYGTGINYYPDLLIQSSILQQSLITFDQPVSKDDHKLESTLVDMEASGAWLAASKFIGPESFDCLKVVADHLEPKAFSKSEAQNLVQKHLGAIVERIEQRLELTAANSSMPHDYLEEELAELVLDLQLTKAQQQILAALAEQYESITKKSISEFLRFFKYPESRHKSANKMIFNKLQMKLEIEIKKNAN